MARDLLAAIDAGTTGTRCLIVDPDGSVVASAYRAHRQITPRPGFVEHDPVELASNTDHVIREAIGTGGVGRGRIAGVGIANQRETIVLWDRATGTPVANAIVWQDTRTAARCDELATEASWIAKRTGLVVAPYFSATKLAWLLDHVAGARSAAERGALAAGTVDSWLVHHLTGAHVTDATNASRTLLASLAGLTWDSELLEVFGVPEGILPTIVPSWQPGGYASTRADGPFGEALPVCAILGDQQAALVGQACFAAGTSKTTYGTGSFLLVHTGEAPTPSRNGLLTSPAYLPPDGPAAYCLEGSMPVTGGAIAWLRDGLGLFAAAEESEALAASVPDTGGVTVIPAFQGLYAPWWDAGARAAITGLSLHSTSAHVVRATLEAICFLTRAVLDAAGEDTGVPVSALRVDGGAARNDLLLRLQADVLGIPVLRAAHVETTALGAAYAAGLAAGVWSDPAELVARHRVDRVFEPSWSADRRDGAYTAWSDALARVRTNQASSDQGA